MIQVYIHINQLNNFLINKEPVELNILPPNENFVSLLLPTKDLIFTEYHSYISIELKTFKKLLKRGWKKIWKKK